MSDYEARERAMVELFRPLILHWEPQIEARLKEGLHSTLIIYITGHNAFDLDFKEGEFLGEWKLKASMLPVGKSKACRVRILLQTCEAGGFQDVLTNQFQYFKTVLILILLAKAQLIMFLFSFSLALSVNPLFNE